MVPALASSLGVFIGIAIGFFVWARPLERARGRLVQAMADVRAHVLPVLERRASTLDVPREARGARDAEDSIQSTSFVNPVARATPVCSTKYSTSRGFLNVLHVPKWMIQFVKR